MSGTRTTATLIALATACVAAATPAPAEGRLLVASSAEHLWIVRESPRSPGTFDLLHHAHDMRGPHAGVAAVLRAAPEAIAADGDRVWVVLPPREDRAIGRSVSTLRVRKRPEIEMYATEPEGRLALLDMLPGDRDLISFVAVGGRPVALMRGFDRETGMADLQLLELRGDRWRSASLPPRETAGGEALLATDGPGGARLNLLASDPHDPGRALLFRRDAGTWVNEPVQVNVDLGAVRSAMNVRGRLAAALTDAEEPGAAVTVAYLRPVGLLPVTDLDPPDGDWGIGGMHDGFRVVVQGPDEGAALVMAAIHWMTGEVTPFEEVTRPPLPAGRLWHITLMLTIAVIAVLLVLLVRPGAIAPGAEAKSAVELPDRTAVLSPISRIFALAIDLLPGAILALLILRVPPVELLRLPIITHSLDQAAPQLIMIGITVLHVTLTELLKSTSLGKALMGGRVISVDGTRPTAKQALMRNAMKVMILIVPPLAVFALLNRHLQGFNDLLAQTVVVGDLPEEDDRTDIGEKD